MFDFLDTAIISLRAAVSRKWQSFKSEKGASDIVAIIVVIAIILIVAVIFRDALKEAVEKVFDNLNEFIDEK